MSPALELTQPCGRGFWWAQRCPEWGFSSQDLGTAAALHRYDRLGSIQQGRHTITREEDYVFDLQVCGPGVVR